MPHPIGARHAAPLLILARRGCVRYALCSGARNGKKKAPRIHRGHLILLKYSESQSAGAFFAGAFLPGPFLVGAVFSSGKSSVLILALSHVSRNGVCE